MLRMNEAYTPTLWMTHSLSSAQALHPSERAFPLVIDLAKNNALRDPTMKFLRTPAPTVAQIFLSQNFYHSLL